MADQYTNSKVQPKDYRSGWVIALIIAGTGLTLSIFYLGAEIALGIGFKKAIWAFGISTFILSLLCLATTRIGNRSRFSTYMILYFSFGKQGAKILNFVFGIVLLGWFSVTLELLSVAVADTALATFNMVVPHWPIIMVMGALITVTTIYGIQSLERLTNIGVPFLALFLLYVYYVSFQDGMSFSQIIDFVPEEPSLTLFEAVAILVGSTVFLPVFIADFSRFTTNDKHSLIAVLGILLGSPFALYFSAVPAIQTGEVDIIKIMTKFDLVLPAFVLLFLSTWVTNSLNLFSAALAFATIKTRWGYKKLTLIASFFGIAFALMGITAHFFVFLNALGVLIPSISSIYMVHFFWIKKQRYELEEVQDWDYSALLSWGVASGVAFCTYLELFQLTHAYFVDSFLVGGLIYIFLNRKQIKRLSK
ncbi:purine-cytosine permease family protein [Flagellimonas sp.]|uniref:purine-cytosine permease family protein n=1 Tax=Flagellimonas sp. TaxID=2058762 RepID=UPI003B51ECF3